MAPKNDINLDSILSELGEFGKFQQINFILICIPITLATVSAFSYVFAAGTSDYRCRIPECDSTDSTKLEYTPLWIANAVPVLNNKPSFCTRYQPMKNDTDNVILEDECPSILFTKNVISCNTSDLIFPNKHTTIANDFNIYCEENHWRLTIVGTLNGLGQFICLPFTGMISDRYGRKTVLMVSIILSTIVGICRSFSTTISTYMALEMLDTTLGAGAFSTGFILGMELVGPSYRVLACAILSICFAIGEILVGVAAWYIYSWRTFLRVIYAPGFILLFYYWLIPESLRWLISKNRITEVQRILKKMSLTNRKNLSDKSVELLLNAEDTTEENPIPQASVLTAMKNRTLLLRFLNCSVAWIVSNLTYYGLSLNSVAISGNKYINFISVAAAEIPAYILTTALLDRLGRRITLCGSFFIAGIACLSFVVIPKGGYLQIIFIIIGKCAATVSFTAVYIFTTELFPTCVRHSILGYCSMLSKFAGTLAPHTPLLALIWGPLPLVIFGSIALVAGSLALFFPETLNTKLPNTIEESENLNRKRRRQTA